MAKSKFFYNRVYNAKRNIINYVIIGLCVIGIIICFIFTSKFYGTNPNAPQGNLDIKSEVTIELNDNVTKEMFFTKIENVNLDDIEITYPDNFNTSTVGHYNINIIVQDNTYKSILNVVDTEKPILAVKDVSISENEGYSANSFVSSCTDNSNKNCVISFYNSLDEDGNIVNYSKYTKNGTYNIVISAKDESGNETIKNAKLIINKKNSTTPPVVAPEDPVECKYGNAEYDTNNYILAVPITLNNCAVSLDLYKDASMTEKINALMENETKRIKKDIDALKLSGKFALNRQITVVLNTTGSGVVGYELTIVVNVTEGTKSSNVVSYKVNSDGKRVFTNNPYSLSE